MQEHPMKIAVVGGGGRMGKSLIKVIHENPSVVLQSVIVRKGSSLVGKDVSSVIGISPIGVKFSDDISKSLQSIDGIIDFSSPACTLETLEISSKMNLVYVIGTTGFSLQENERINSFALHSRIVKSGNMSLGINFLSLLVKFAARCLPANHWDFEILEMHHRHKLDSPSGTALFLGEAIANGRNSNISDSFMLNRNKQDCVREEGSIGFATLRGGSVVGEHSVVIAGEGESIMLSHSAYDRSIFARGAVTAAIWALSKAPGLYSMLDVLDFGVFGNGKINE
ncbi:MAG: 4-hydroxy-tetrahydrodipicolinate reductase [Candidatus Liberibacter europaeus]|uniref:4-hydroxy-tetrahydrodipicolinate reductase n=1 Tax=Candidatus Liberibacter europaeus TaxID=744859 RepID=A0A2T4VY15_9HYPH|nr:4-hydroxy-tetrahydrodipicolinate reductase [Candidatus Liberibacter europaeus]PTL86664.1 MAG: 4-hydroxy-tetrahydrodipicolinate reductase [Candidatus Liberibacter europaeus]